MSGGAQASHECGCAVSVDTAAIPAVARTSVPRWVRTVDGLAVTLFGLAALLIVGDGVRFEVAGIRIAIISALRVAAWAVVLALALAAGFALAWRAHVLAQSTHDVLQQILENQAKAQAAKSGKRR